MAKIHPGKPASSSSSCSTERETYTIWMKSLVLNSNGYTAYDSSGEVVFRIDNYDTKCRSEVYLMDLRGNIVCTILRKVILSKSCYYIYILLLLIVRTFKLYKFIKLQTILQKLLKSGLWDCYNDKDSRTPWFSVERKRSSSGVELGEDVLCVTVEPHVDRIFIMALVAIHG
ncbi:putative tubby-like protein [Helianthus annuus]|nr:putative tubby-like protein [Helianthus annuus]